MAVPPPVFTTTFLTIKRAGFRVNVAVTFLSDVILDIVQLPVPGQFIPIPLQPVKSDPAPGVAVRTIPVPLVRVVVQVKPQSISPIPLFTVPVPTLYTLILKIPLVIKVLVIVQIADSPLASVIEFDGGNINAPFWQV